MVVLGLTVADGVLFVVENSGDDTIRVVTDTPVDPSRPDKPTVNLESLNLFGTVRKTATPSVIDAPATRLNLELQGVFLSDDKASSTAIVAEKNKTGELFHIGDRLPGNAVLAAVLEDHILIRRGGRMEKLMFTDSKLRSSAKRQAGTETAPPASSTRLQQIRERLARRQQSGGRSRQVTAPPGSSLRNYIDSNRDRINSNPAELLSEIGMAPVAEGEARGYRISSGVSQASLMQAGLQQGDIILSVNGKPVGDIASDAALIDQTLQSKRVRVEVQRGKRRFFLTVPVP